MVWIVVEICWSIIQIQKTPLWHLLQSGVNSRVGDVVHHQIGEHFVYGPISGEWITHQQYDSINSLLSISIWASQLIRQDWELIQNMVMLQQTTKTVLAFMISVAYHNLQHLINQDWQLVWAPFLPPISSHTYFLTRNFHKNLLSVLLRYCLSIQCGRDLYNDHRTHQDQFN